MSSQAKKLLSETLRLPRKSRAMIADKLIASLEEKDELAAAVDVAEQRWQDYKDGKIKGIPIEEVFPSVKSTSKTIQP